MADYLSVQQAAQRVNRCEETIRRILRDEVRRQQLFPGAVFIGEGRRGQWRIPAAEVEAVKLPGEGWQKGRKRK